MHQEHCRSIYHPRVGTDYNTGLYIIHHHIRTNRILTCNIPQHISLQHISTIIKNSIFTGPLFNSAMLPTPLYYRYIIFYPAVFPSRSQFAKHRQAFFIIIGHKNNLITTEDRPSIIIEIAANYCKRVPDIIYHHIFFKFEWASGPVNIYSASTLIQTVFCHGVHPRYLFMTIFYSIFTPSRTQFRYIIIYSFIFPSSS